MKSIFKKIISPLKNENGAASALVILIDRKSVV